MSDNHASVVGQRIKDIRTNQLGLSMTDFGARIDPKVKSGTVANWETGKNLPNNERLKKIAQIGGISVNELLYGDPKTYLDNILWNNKEIEEYSTVSLNKFYEHLKNTVEDEDSLYLSEEEAVSQYKRFIEDNPVYEEDEEQLEKNVFSATFNFFNEQNLKTNSDSFNKTLDEAKAMVKKFNIRSFEQKRIEEAIPFAYSVANNIMYEVKTEQNELINLLKKEISDVNLAIKYEEATINEEGFQDWHGSYMANLNEILEFYEDLIEDIENTKFDFYIYSGRIYLTVPQSDLTIDSITFDSESFDVAVKYNAIGEAIEVIKSPTKRGLLDLLKNKEHDEYVEIFDYHTDGLFKFNYSNLDNEQIISNKYPLFSFNK